MYEVIWCSILQQLTKSKRCFHAQKIKNVNYCWSRYQKYKDHISIASFYMLTICWICRMIKEYIVVLFFHNSNKAYHKASKNSLNYNPVPTVKVGMNRKFGLHQKPKRCNHHHKKVEHKSHQACKSPDSSNNSTNDWQECPTERHSNFPKVSLGYTGVDGWEF